MPEVRLPTDRDHRREALVELFKLCVQEAGIDGDYDADIEYMESAIEKFADAMEVATYGEGDRG